MRVEGTEGRGTAGNGTQLRAGNRQCECGCGFDLPARVGSGRYLSRLHAQHHHRGRDGNRGPITIEIPADEHPMSATAYREILRGDPCCYCGAPCTIRATYVGQIDHIVARCDGGANTWDNLTAACERCNHNKAGGPLLRWLLVATYFRRLGR